MQALVFDEKIAQRILACFEWQFRMLKSKMVDYMKQIDAFSFF